MKFRNKFMGDACSNNVLKTLKKSLAKALYLLGQQGGRNSLLSKSNVGLDLRVGPRPTSGDYFSVTRTFTTIHAAESRSSKQLVSIFGFFASFKIL